MSATGKAHKVIPLLRGKRPDASTLAHAMSPTKAERLAALLVWSDAKTAKDAALDEFLAANRRCEVAYANYTAIRDVQDSAGLLNE